TYDSIVIPAQAAYDTAGQTHAERLAAAERDYSKRIADASKVEEVANALAMRDREVAIADAIHSRDTSDENADETYLLARSNYDLFERNRLIAPNLQKSFAVALADKTLKDEVALHRHDFTVAVANAVLTWKTGVIQATADLDEATAQAKAAAFANWAATEGTPWAAYQSALFTNIANSVSTVKPNLVNQQIAKVTADTARQIAAADAERDHAYAMDIAEYDRFVNSTQARLDMAQTENNQAQSFTDLAISERHAKRITIIDADHDYATNVADAEKLRNSDDADARHQYGYDLADAEYQKAVDISNNVNPEPTYSNAVALAVSIFHSALHAHELTYAGTEQSEAGIRDKAHFDARKQDALNLLSSGEKPERTALESANLSEEQSIATVGTANYESAKAAADAARLSANATAMATFVGAVA
ncbi:MAG TPA: hypothetical protein VK137_19245, partial [Planctomycetaceae bacterium]|nr:hypothetical protein [Planctomycetaceae bacterium]